MQLNSNKYFKEILEDEIKSEFVIADVLRNSDRQKEFTFSFEEISLDITRQLISSKQFAKLKLLGRANNFEDDKKGFLMDHLPMLPRIGLSHIFSRETQTD